MSGERPEPRREHFQEAIAHWQLRLQTEVKKASSLPTAMFDACDPMLEAKLAEATEGIFTWLLNQCPPAGDRLPEEDKRLEQVSTAELAQLAAMLAQQPATDEPVLDDGQQAEYLGILADACSTGDPVVQAHAARHLQRDFPLARTDAEHDLAAALFEQVRTLLAGGAVDDATIERTSACIAAVVLRALDRDAPPQEANA
jgi:hypothetical protein